MSRQVYLYTGPEVGEKNDAVKNVKKSLEKKFGPVDEYLFYASETSPSEYLAILDNENLFSNATCVVVKNAEAIKKADEIEQIVNWINSSGSESSVLILLTDDYSVNAKIDKAVPPSSKTTFFELSESKREQWIKSFFSKNGLTIDEEAVSLIIEMLESNTESLKNECRRFTFVFEKGHNISSDDVESVLLDNKEETAFTLFDTLTTAKSGIDKCLEKSLDCLQKIRLSKENYSAQILMALASCFRKQITYNKLCDSGMNDDFTLKKNGFTSKKMRAQFSRGNAIWSTGQCHAILASIAGTDMEIRFSGTLLEDVCLQRLIYEIVVKKGGSSSVYED